MAATRIAIAAGGTAGHIYPALALAEAFQRRRPGGTILFLGTPAGLEARLVAEAGYRLEVIPGTPFQRTDARGRARALATAAAGFWRARRLLRNFRADAVIGFGGYASVGSVLAARSLRIWTAIHESNVTAGLANRALAPMVNRVYLTYERTAARFPFERVRLIGTPIRRAIAKLAEVPRIPRSRGGAPAGILVLAGTENSTFLNTRAPELLSLIRRRGVDLDVFHQAGPEEAEATARAYSLAGIRATVTSHLDDMGRAYANADFVISRAGGSTIAELAAAGLPALVVPLDRAARNHQRHNAETFQSSGAGILGEESRWVPGALADAVYSLLADSSRWGEASRSARRLSRPDAAEAIVEDCFPGLTSP